MPVPPNVATIWAKFSRTDALTAGQKIIGVNISLAEFSLGDDYDHDW